MQPKDRVNVYFSGVQDISIEWDERLITCDTEQFRLLSCHGSYINYAHKCLEGIINSGHNTSYNILLDSGAFTAWNSGAEITLDEITDIFGTMVDRYEKHFKNIYMINLDKLPGSPDRPATQEEINEAITVSTANCRILTKRFGERLLPVFHLGEPESLLKELAEEFAYICLSPLTRTAEKFRVDWAKKTHQIIKNKTHGLATTGYRQLRQVPWFSVDSAAWLMSASFGGVILPRGEKFIQLQLSSQSGKIKDRNGHFDNMGKAVQEKLRAEFKQLGFDIDLMRDDVVERCTFNRVQQIRFAKKPQIKTPVQTGLFAL